MTEPHAGPELPEELIEQWIKEYGSVYYFPHGGELYVFRAIKRWEYRIALEIEDEFEREDEVVKRCTLWPQQFAIDDNAPAGIVTALCAEVMRISGCVNLQDHFLAMRTHIESDIESQMETLIEYVFGGDGDFERYKHWSHKKLFDAYYRAEWMLRNKKLLEEGGLPQAINVGGKQIDPRKLDPKQRQQLMMQHRVEQVRAAAPPSTGSGDFTVQGEEGSVSLNSAVDAYAGGPAALQNMGEFMRRNQKFHAQQAIRKVTSS